jgi:predicted ATP-grasp superfamily ATP-dependent carboligase
MRILIIGISTRGMAESAKTAGYDLVTIDYFGDYDQKSWCENLSLKRDLNLSFGSAQLFEASRDLKFDAVAYTSNLENHAEVIKKFEAAGAEENYSLLGNSADVLSRVRHWPTLFGFLQKQGIPVPKTIYGGQQPGANDKRRWLRKPIQSGGGHDIGFWERDRSVGTAFVLQEQLPGISASASFVANGKECVVLGLTEQLIGRPEFGARDFRYCGNILPLTAVPGAVLTQVRDIATRLTREFKLVGVNGLDFMLQEGQVFFLEVNPRYSASMELIERAYGLSIFDLHVQSIQHGVLPDFDVAARWADTGFYGKAILYAEQDGIAPDTRGWPARDIRDVPFSGEALSAGDPVCTVLVSGLAQAECFAGLVAQADVIKGEIYAR